MRVLFHTKSLTRSGAGLFFAASGLAKALVDHGVAVIAVGGADEHFEEDREAWGAATLYPSTGASQGYGFDCDAFTAAARIKPDLVHIHGIWSSMSLYGGAAALGGMTTVVSPHGMLDPWILARRPLLKQVHAALIERPLLRRAWVHVLNDAERTAVTAFAPSAADRIFIVPNGIPDVAIPVTSRKRSGALFLGRLHAKKQVVELVRAWRSLELTPEECLTIAGWGNPAYDAEVRQAIDGAPDVDFAGPLHGDEKSSALAYARFFILPSLSEGLPMAVLEAIQHGCIPIITPECNLPELFANDIALPMAADFSDFAAVLTRAYNLSDAELRRRSAAASDYARKYAWPKIAEAMIGHYQRCIAQKNPAPIGAH